MKPFASRYAGSFHTASVPKRELSLTPSYSSTVASMVASSVSGLNTFGPPVSMDWPPQRNVFSTLMTFKPASCAVREAMVPAAPAPTTTTSQVSVSCFCSGAAGALTNVAVTALAASLSLSPAAMYACVSASRTAFLMPVEEPVAPVTLSTPMDCAVRIAGSSCANAPFAI